MKLTSLLLTSLVASAAFLAQGAYAQTISRSAAVSAIADGQGGFNAHFGDTFTAASAGRSFSDIFTFDLGTPLDAAASVTSSYLNVPLTKDLLITGLNLYRYDPATMAVLGTVVTGINESGFGPYPTDSWSLDGYGLAAGNYALRVDGRVLGAGGGAFGGDLVVSPVPEPVSWGLLLGGLGGLALLARWQRRP